MEYFHSYRGSPLNNFLNHFDCYTKHYISHHIDNKYTESIENPKNCFNFLNYITSNIIYFEKNITY